jgi:L-galactono-1,5-lactonase
MIVDAHMHVWSRLDGMIENRLPVRPLRGGMIRIGDSAMLGMPAYMLDCQARADYVVAEFDAAGVDAGVVVQEYMDGVQNDYLQEVLARFPGRFFAHALPNYWDADGVAAEANELFRRGFRGLKMPAAHFLGQLRLDDPRLMPIWREMEETERILAVDLAEGDVQTAEMENIVASFPKLRVALGHFGMVNRGGWPGQLRLGRHKNVYLETGGIIWLYRHEGFPFPGALEAILRAKQEVGIEKLMWGSDWPRTMIDFTYRQSIEFVRNAEALSEEEKGLLLGGNARRLYRLPDVEHPRQPVALITES